VISLPLSLLKASLPRPTHSILSARPHVNEMVQLWDSEAELDRQRLLKHRLEDELPYNRPEKRHQAKRKAIEQAVKAEADAVHSRRSKKRKA